MVTSAIGHERTNITMNDVMTRAVFPMTTAVMSVNACWASLTSLSNLDIKAPV